MLPNPADNEQRYSLWDSLHRSRWRAGTLKARASGRRAKEARQGPPLLPPAWAARIEPAKAGLAEKPPALERAARLQAAAAPGSTRAAEAPLAAEAWRELAPEAVAHRLATGAAEPRARALPLERTWEVSRAEVRKTTASR